MAKEVEISKQIFDEIKKKTLIEFGSTNTRYISFILIPEEIAINYNISLPMAERVIRLVKFLIYKEFDNPKYEVSFKDEDVYGYGYRSSSYVRGYKVIISKKC